jgi:hypothetical protein
MALPKRFALSTLLLVMLLVSLVFGYAQWRKQYLIRAVEELNESGLTEVPFRVTDNPFWPHVTPRLLVVVFKRNSQGQLVRGGKIYGDDKLKPLFAALEARYRPIGVDPLFQEFQQLKNRTQYRQIRLDK